MPLPIPNLDDRRFDDLVAEAITRIEAHTPEWSNIAPVVQIGDRQRHHARPRVRVSVSCSGAAAGRPRAV